MNRGVKTMKNYLVTQLNDLNELADAVHALKLGDRESVRFNAERTGVIYSVEDKDAKDRPFKAFILVTIAEFKKDPKVVNGIRKRAQEQLAGLIAKAAEEK